MNEKMVKINSCCLCKHEGADDIHDTMVCTNEDPVRPIGMIGMIEVEIPDWCRLEDAPRPGKNMRLLQATLEEMEE